MTRGTGFAGGRFRTGSGAPGVLLCLLLFAPTLALGAMAPQQAPLPKEPPTAGAAPEHVPQPAARPDAEAAPTGETSAEPAPAAPPRTDTRAPVAAPLPERTADPDSAGPPAPAREAAERSPYAVATAPLPPSRPGLKGSTLIGIFALTTGRMALLRFPSGEVRRVSVGDEIDGWRVNSITRDSLRVRRDGRERTLVLVGS